MNSNSPDTILKKIDIIYILEQFLFITKEAFFLNYENINQRNIDNSSDAKECIVICNIVQIEIVNFLKLYYSMYCKLLTIDCKKLEECYNHLIQLINWKIKINCYLNSPKNGFAPFLTDVLEEHPDLKTTYIKYRKNYKKTSQL